jgi:Fe-S cluster biogenesis protein NfuA
MFVLHSWSGSLSAVNTLARERRRTYHVPDRKREMAKSAPSNSSADDRTTASLFDRVEEILSLIRPAIQSDGGDVELVDVSDDGVVAVRFLGACIGCPSSSITLQAGIERQLKDRLPEVTRVDAVS